MQDEQANCNVKPTFIFQYVQNKYKVFSPRRSFRCSIRMKKAHLHVCLCVCVRVCVCVCMCVCV